MNEMLAECDPLARLLFVGLWTEADRDGRLEDKPRRLKAVLLPYDKCDVQNLLDQLCERGLITRYNVGGTSYIAIPTWYRHQRPHPKEPSLSYPDPPGYQKTTDCSEFKSLSSRVYFIREGGLLKIGYSANLSARLKAIKHDEVCAVIWGDTQVERTIHKYLHGYQVYGEWFRFSADPVRLVLDWAKHYGLDRRTTPDIIAQEMLLIGVATRGEGFLTKAQEA